MERTQYYVFFFFLIYFVFVFVNVSTKRSKYRRSASVLDTHEQYSNLKFIPKNQPNKSTGTEGGFTTDTETLREKKDSETQSQEEVTTGRP